MTTENEKQEGLLVYLGIAPNSKRRLYAYAFSDPAANRTEHLDDRVPWYFAKRLHAGNATPGLVLKITYSTKADGGHSIHTMTEDGRWENHQQAIFWQATQTAIEAAEAAAREASRVRNLSELRESLEPVRRALRGMTGTHRRALIGWVVDYLLS